jgi:hypothetical protein
MSQKSSVPQAAKFVSQALKRDREHAFRHTSAAIAPLLRGAPLYRPSVPSLRTIWKQGQVLAMRWKSMSAVCSRLFLSVSGRNTKRFLPETRHYANFEIADICLRIDSSIIQVESKSAFLAEAALWTHGDAAYLRSVMERYAKGNGEKKGAVQRRARETSYRDQRQAGSPRISWSG